MLLLWARDLEEEEDAGGGGGGRPRVEEEDFLLGRVAELTEEADLWTSPRLLFLLRTGCLFRSQMPKSAFLIGDELGETSPSFGGGMGSSF